jgi:hypothetical protein
MTPQVLEDQEVSAQGDGQSCTCLGEKKSDTRDIIALHLCFLLHLMHLSHNVSNVTESESLKWLKYSHTYLRLDS